MISFRSTFFVASLALLGCTSTPTLAGPGEPCPSEGADGCTTGLCTPPDIRDLASVCSMECASNDDCAAVGDEMTCDGGICVHGCGLRDFEEGDWICLEGLPVPCADTDPAETCFRCGCEVFGFDPRATCENGIGCLAPAENGEPCGVDEMCDSGFCEASICTAPADVGEPCMRNAGCASSNCGNDASPSQPGTCNVAVGAPCDETTPCTTCRDGVCFRDSCTQGVAASCPSGYQCEGTSTGGNYCFQSCVAPGFDCRGATCCRGLFGEDISDGQEGICVGSCF